MTQQREPGQTAAEAGTGAHEVTPGCTQAPHRPHTSWPLLEVMDRPQHFTGSVLMLVFLSLSATMGSPFPVGMGSGATGFLGSWAVAPR
ncbi:hypothetical protein Sfulv_62420 [Streptomyces fulvorobeus]|uniref:Uncharacterized protein n=1 Tax=Streptomyces fulvorobeus TaxID=284028 RepID=A0A7J0CG36_9ACTN|nr:hypothetical protein Sfulv_62420 [Streptomyces fulvorobeus]